MYIFFNILSRCLRAVPWNEENKSAFLVGVNNNQNSFIHRTLFDNEEKKLTTSEIVNFESYSSGKVINDIVDIYSNDNCNDNYNDKGSNKFYTQIYNQTDEKYELKMFSNNENESGTSKMEMTDLTACDSDKLFDIKIIDEGNSLYTIRNSGISKVDINRPCEELNLIKLSGYDNDNSNSNTNHISNEYLKICSDISKLDSNHIAIGLNTSLFFVDISSDKIINKIENAHYNGILSLEFDPFHSFNFATSGMDYSVKFWDTRNLSHPVSSIFNNTHWVWNSKFNKQFSRLMINCSSSSIVKAVIFNKESEEENDSKTNASNIFTPLSRVDYSEFDDSVYSLDWSQSDPWVFAAVSYNSLFYINSIPEDIKYKIMLDN